MVLVVAVARIDAAGGARRSSAAPRRAAPARASATAPAPRRAAAKPAAKTVHAQQAAAQGFALDLAQGGPDERDEAFREYA